MIHPTQSNQTYGPRLKRALRAFVASLILLVISSSSLHAQISTNGLQIWLMGDVGATNVGNAQVKRWLDQGPLHNDAVQTNNASGSQPHWTNNVINGHATVRFDSGRHDFMCFTNRALNLTNGMSVFIVAKNRVRANNNGLFRIGPSGSPYNASSDLELQWDLGTAKSGNAQILLNRDAADYSIATLPDYGPPINNFYIIDDITQWTVSGLRVNQTNVNLLTEYPSDGVSAPAAPRNLNWATIGVGEGSAGQSLDGDIAEVIVYNRAVPVWERDSIWSYLSAKYNIGMPLKANLVFFEAENMSQSGGWASHTYDPATYDGFPSGTKYLSGNTPGTTGVSTNLTPFGVTNGTYRIWVRYMNNQDLIDYGFQVKLLQGGVSKGVHTFNSTNTELFPNVWTWQYFDSSALTTTNPCVIELSRTQDYGGGWRMVDCFVLTRDKGYVPKEGDFARPLYAKVTMDATGNPTPAVVQFSSYGQPTPGHLSGGGVAEWDLSKRDFFAGNGGVGPAEDFLKNGDSTPSSPWVNIAPALDIMEYNNLRFEMITNQIDGANPVGTSAFTLSLARTNNGTGLIGTYHRSGTGCALNMMINNSSTNVDNTVLIQSDLGWSQYFYSAATNQVAMAGRQPTNYPVITFDDMDDGFSAATVITNDMKSLQALGFSGTMNCLVPVAQMKSFGLKYAAAQSTVSPLQSTGYGVVDFCHSQTPWGAATNDLVAGLAQYPNIGDLQWCKIGDEIFSDGVDHIATEPYCTNQFRNYMVSLGYTAANSKPNMDPTSGNPTNYYYLIRYRCKVITDFLKKATGIVKGLRPEVETVANGGTEMVTSWNLLTRGRDIFEIYKTNAVTVGFEEDANNYAVSEQSTSYTMDMLRSACKYKTNAYGVLTFLDHGTWDMGVKMFNTVGHGGRLLDLYKWGPWYLSSADSHSQTTNKYPTIKQFAYALGGVENFVIHSKPVKSKVAILYSHTTDAWDAGLSDGTNPTAPPAETVFGAEQQYLHLLLTHLGYPVEILTEDDVLSGSSTNYKAIFVTGKWLKNGVLTNLVNWTSNGGTLYVGPGTAEKNQFNGTATNLNAFGWKRQAYNFFEPPGSDQNLGSGNLVVQDTIPYGTNTFDVLCGYQRLGAGTAGTVLLTNSLGTNYVSKINVGSGKLVFSGFFAGLTYVQKACVPIFEQSYASGGVLPSWNPPYYPGAVRDFFKAEIVPLIAWTPPVTCSDYRVEGSLLMPTNTGARTAVLTLANWSQIEVRSNVTFSVTMPGIIFTNAIGTINTLTGVSTNGGVATFTVPVLGRGDFVKLPYK